MNNLSYTYLLAYKLQYKGLGLGLGLAGPQTPGFPALSVDIHVPGYEALNLEIPQGRGSHNNRSLKEV